MGKMFGDLAVIRGIIYYKLSPYEQKPFAGAITYGLPNTANRIIGTLWTYLPGIVTSFYIVCLLVGLTQLMPYFGLAILFAFNYPITWQSFSRRQNTSPLLNDVHTESYFTVFIIGYATYAGVEEAYRLSKRKNPKDYMNEVDPNPPKCPPKQG